MELDKLSKLSPAEEKLLRNFRSGKGLALSVLDQDDDAKDSIKKDVTEPEQNKAGLNETTDIQDKDEAHPAAALHIEPNPLEMAGGQPQPAPAQKKIAGKPVANLKSEFSEVRGKMPTEKTPSLAQTLFIQKPVDKDERSKAKMLGDTSMILNGESDRQGAGIAKARNELREEAQGVHSYVNSRDNRESLSSSSVFATQQDWQREVDNNRAYMGTLRTQIADNDRKLTALRNENVVIDQKIMVLKSQQKTLQEESAALKQEVIDAHQDMVNAEKAIPEASARLASKMQEKYPDGKMPGANEPDPVRDAEEKMRKDAYDKNRPEIYESYKNAGVGKEFLILEKVANGEKVDPSVAAQAIDKAQAAGQPFDPNIKMLESVRRDDPNNPLLDSFYASKLDVMAAGANVVQKQAHFAETQSAAAQQKIKDIDQQLEGIDKTLKTLNEKKAENEQKIKEIETIQAEMKDKLDKAQKYDAWLNSPEVKEKLKNGGTGVSIAEFKAHAPPELQDGWVDYNSACVDPNSALGQEIAAKATAPAAASSVASAQAASRTSAAGSGIEADSATEQFNAAASATATPAPQAPAPVVQKPVPVAQPGMAV